ncbi:MAG: hypothetical protein WBB00_18800 [Mycobacterium sp.]
MRNGAGVLAVLLTLAIAGAAAPAAAQPTPEPSPPVPVPEVLPGTPALMFTDEPAIVDTNPMQPEAWSRTTDERMVRLHFTTGTPECFGVAATVHETADDVVVDLRSGTLPKAVGRACIMIAVFGGLDVPLQNPLGIRRVLSVA